MRSKFVDSKLEPIEFHIWQFPKSSGTYLINNSDLWAYDNCEVHKNDIVTISVGFSSSKFKCQIRD